MEHEIKSTVNSWSSRHQENKKRKKKREQRERDQSIKGILFIPTPYLHGALYIDRKANTTGMMMMMIVFLRQKTT